MQTVDKNISDLIPAEYNPRQLSEKQAEDLKASMQRFDAVEPAVINTNEERENIIISGHQRIKVAKQLGWKTYPCVEVDLDRDQERELNIRMNKNTGSWDWDLLANYFDQEELTDWGFTDEELFGDAEGEETEKEPEDKSDQISESLRVEIEVESETEQEQVYNEMQERGYKCRILTL